MEPLAGVWRASGMWAGEQPPWPALPDGIAKVLGGREEACAQAAGEGQGSGQSWQGGRGVLMGALASASVC